jgi:rRNA maturation RNase YbeY
MAVSFHLLQLETQILDGEKRKLSRWIKQIIEKHHRKTGDVSVILTNEKDLLALNKKHLQHNFHTDIITFDYNEGILISGDLFISLDRIKDNAKLYNVTTKQELFRVIIHGVLHLLGFKDKTKTEQQEMRNKEDEALSLFI